MGRVVLLLLLAVSVGGLLAVTGAARSPAPPAGFRLADGSAGCVFDGRLTCRTTSMSSAVVLEADGSSSGADVAVEWNDTMPVLRPTESWWHEGFSCRVADAELVCERGSGSIAVGPGGVGGASSVTDAGP